MAQSPDWPDLPYVQARAFGTGRDGKTVKYSVIHYTAGSERSTAAEDGAAYDQRRTDGVSTHYFHDRDSTIQCVRLADRANAAFHKGNRLGIQHELCGTVQTRAQWLDAASYPTLDRAAFQVARDHLKFGIPVRRLSVAEVRACWYSGGPGGICGHVDVTNAYPEDGGTHTDPGVEFPWDVFMGLVQTYYEGGAVASDLDQNVAPYGAVRENTYMAYHLGLALMRGEDALHSYWEGKDGGPVPNNLQKTLQAILDKPAVEPAPVDADALAAALATNEAFLDAIAKRVVAELGRDLAD